MVGFWMFLRIAGKVAVYSAVASLPLIPLSFWSLTPTSPVWLSAIAQWVRELLGIGPELQFWGTFGGTALKLVFAALGFWKSASTLRRWWCGKE